MLLRRGSKFRLTFMKIISSYYWKVNALDGRFHAFEKGVPIFFKEGG